MIQEGNGTFFLIVMKKIITTSIQIPKQYPSYLTEELFPGSTYPTGIRGGKEKVSRL